jgi:fermentation-respiration switch protein FrsA (DUF1100 family)
VIPLRLGQALYAAANEPKSFWLLPGAGHNDIAETAGPSYCQRLNSFYSGLPGPTRHQSGAKAPRRLKPALQSSLVQM